MDTVSSCICDFSLFSALGRSYERSSTQAGEKNGTSIALFNKVCQSYA